MTGKQAELSVKTAPSGAGEQDEAKVSPTSQGTIDTGIFNTTADTPTTIDRGALQPLLRSLWALANTMGKGGERPAAAKIPATDDQAYHKCFCRGSKLFVSFLLNSPHHNATKLQ